MDGVLNENTNTVHKHVLTDSDLEASCGATTQLKREDLRMTSVAEATADPETSRCGRCFEDAGGY